MEKENVDQMTIGQRIKYFRKRKGYTQKEIGELLGFASTIRNRSSSPEKEYVSRDGTVV